MEDEFHKTSTVINHTNHTVRIYFDPDTDIPEVWGQRKALNNLVMSMSRFIYYVYRENWAPGDIARKHTYELRITNLSEHHALILEDLNYVVEGAHVMSAADRKRMNYTRLQYKHL